jgi:hypothetical protein
MTGVGSPVVRVRTIVATTPALMTPAVAADGTATEERRGVPPSTPKHARWAGSARVSGWIDVLDEVRQASAEPTARVPRSGPDEHGEALSCRPPEPGCWDLPSRASPRTRRARCCNTSPGSRGITRTVQARGRRVRRLAGTARRGLVFRPARGAPDCRARTALTASARLWSPNTLGAWVPAPPAFSPPLEPLAGSQRPWTPVRARCPLACR